MLEVREKVVYIHMIHYIPNKNMFKIIAENRGEGHRSVVLWF